MVELRDQMAETTKQINAMTGEYVAMKESAHQYDSLIASLQQENDRVRGLLEELVQDKKNKEKQMDQVEAEVEKRIGQMTDILEFKVSFVLSRKKCRLGCLSHWELQIIGFHFVLYYKVNWPAQRKSKLSNSGP